MWTSPNDCVERPQIWDLLSHHAAGQPRRSGFRCTAKGCEADYVCTPAPIHHPDGSESLWCYTRPLELYGTLRDQLGHFPLQHFWGPMAKVQSTPWIADSALLAGAAMAARFLLYLSAAPGLCGPADRPGQRRSRPGGRRVGRVIGRLAAGMQEAHDEELLWLVAGEYAIMPVDHVSYPNRVLREAGLLAVRQEADGEHFDLQSSRAWALVDHQFRTSSWPRRSAVRPGWPKSSAAEPGIAEVLRGRPRGRYGLEHPRSGEVILISTPRSWQAYYWWLPTSGRRRSPARWISTASRATTRWNCTSIRPRRASLWTPRELRARTAARRPTARSAASCWLGADFTCPVRQWPTPTFSAWCCGILA